MAVTTAPASVCAVGARLGEGPVWIARDHALWFVDGQYIHMASGAADFKPRNPLDDQCYQIIDVRNPSTGQI